MALEGSIRDFSLADIFQLIGIQRKTGVLTLKRADEEVKVSFLNGMVVNADSRDRRLDDRLGSVLVKTGKLSAPDLNQVLQMQKQTLRKMGHILLAEEMVKPEDLREALQIQITQIVYRLFRWKDGDYHFEQQASVDYDKDNFRPMSAESILMEGMRMIDEWPIIEKKIPSFDMVFDKVPLEEGVEPLLEDEAGEQEGEASEEEFDLIFGSGEQKRAKEEPSQKIKLSREEAQVYRQVNGQATVQDIIDRTLLSEFEICRALFDLYNRNLVAPVARQTVAPRPGEVEQPKAGFELGGLLGRALYPVLGVALLAGVALQAYNPLNALTRPLRPVPVVKQLEQDEALNRLQRLATATEAYILAHVQYPSSTQELVEAGLLGDEDLLDPWGQPLGLELTQDGIVMSVRLGPDEDAPVHSVRRLFNR